VALKVGDLYYDVTVDTAPLLRGQREAAAAMKRTGKDAEAAAGYYRDLNGRLRDARGRFVGLGEAANVGGAATRQAGEQAEKAGKKLTATAAAVKALVVAYAALKFADMADEWGQYDSRMQMATQSAEEHAHAQQRMRQSANETFRAINETREAFIQMSPVLRTMGLTLDQSIDAIDTFSGLLVVNAASADKGKNAMDALSKAMQKGSIDADAWTSIASTMPTIVDLIAQTTGMATDEIRRLGVEGKLSVNDLTRALVDGNETVMSAVREMPTTFRDAIQNLNNGLSEYVGQVNRASQFSATLTAVVGGAGQVMEQLAAQVTEANDEAEKLGGNTSVERWANATRLVLSYVADAADLVKRGFLQLQTVIGGTAASAVMAAQGNFRQAADTMRQMAADVMAIGNQPYSGARMREAFENGQGAGARTREAVNLKPGRTKPGGKGRSGGGAEFDSAGYLANLERSTLEGVAIVDAAEKEALRRNAELLTQRKITAETAAQAVTLIELNASQERAAIAERENKSRIEAAQRLADEETKAAQQLAESRARGLQMARDAAAVNDPIAQLELRLERETEMLAQYAAQDMANAQFYADAKVALEQETAMRIADVRKRASDEQTRNQLAAISIASDVAGQILAIEQGAGKERSAISKAMFLVQKALAVSEIIINTEVAASKAYSQFGAYGALAAGGIRAAGYASAGLVAGQAVAEVAGGRQYGGPVSANSLYRVNEGGKPEMFTAANGSQYMMPTTDGKVTPAGNKGGDTVINITQHFALSSPTDPRTLQQLGAAAARGIQVAAARNN